CLRVSCSLSVLFVSCWGNLGYPVSLCERWWEREFHSRPHAEFSTDYEGAVQRPDQVVERNVGFRRDPTSGVIDVDDEHTIGPAHAHLHASLATRSDRLLEHQREDLSKPFGIGSQGGKVQRDVEE